jgi:hypothetical protein
MYPMLRAKLTSHHNWFVPRIWSISCGRSLRYFMHDMLWWSPLNRFVKTQHSLFLLRTTRAHHFDFLTTKLPPSGLYEKQSDQNVLHDVEHHINIRHIIIALTDTVEIIFRFITQILVTLCLYAEERNVWILSFCNSLKFSVSAYVHLMFYCIQGWRNHINDKQNFTVVLILKCEAFERNIWQTFCVAGGQTVTLPRQ